MLVQKVTKNTLRGRNFRTLSPKGGERSSKFHPLRTPIITGERHPEILLLTDGTSYRITSALATTDADLALAPDFAAFDTCAALRCCRRVRWGSGWASAGAQRQRVRWGEEFSGEAPPAAEKASRKTGSGALGGPKGFAERIAATRARQRNERAFAEGGSEGYGACADEVALSEAESAGPGAGG